MLPVMLQAQTWHWYPLSAVMHSESNTERDWDSQRCSWPARASRMATEFCMVRLLSPAPARLSDRLMTRSVDGPGAGAGA